MAQFADKLALDTITLAATQGGASPRLVGLLVAAQSAAWLLVSLPAGVFADRVAPRSLILLGAALMIAGSLAGAGLLAAGETGALLAVSTFVAAAGPVVIALSIFVLLPRMVEIAALPRANGRLELGRACFSLAAPLIAGWAVARGAGALGLLLCALAGLVVLAAASRLPGERPAAQPRQPLHRAIAEGGAFVARHPYLRPIALCAIGWNLAFFAFMAVFAPYAARVLLLTPGDDRARLVGLWRGPDRWRAERSRPDRTAADRHPARLRPGLVAVSARLCWRSRRRSSACRRWRSPSSCSASGRSSGSSSRPACARR